MLGPNQPLLTMQQGESLVTAIVPMLAKALHIMWEALELDYTTLVNKLTQSYNTYTYTWG